MGCSKTILMLAIRSGDKRSNQDGNIAAFPGNAKIQHMIIDNRPNTAGPRLPQRKNSFRVFALESWHEDLFPVLVLGRDIPLLHGAGDIPQIEKKEALRCAVW